jgi:hypothetical protein
MADYSWSTGAKLVGSAKRRYARLTKTVVVERGDKVVIYDWRTGQVISVEAYDCSHCTGDDVIFWFRKRAPGCRGCIEPVMVVWNGDHWRVSDYANDD